TRTKRQKTLAPTVISGKGMTMNFAEKTVRRRPMESQTAYKLLFAEYPDVVNVEQMCEMLGGICDKTAYRLLKSGKIKSFIVGRRYRIPKLNILEYLDLIEKSTA
ncbi:helix-turn-helix domain-containing protein, partial [Hominenteromicrobium sp.]|uniref:helix-turn-helix domain-containing protein n=1 Tax=Hominenteromicrobium sp. TaxID=3073581 RepID=UPI003A8D43A4